MTHDIRKQKVIKGLCVYFIAILSVVGGAVFVPENGVHAKKSDSEAPAQPNDKTPPAVLSVTPADKAKDIIMTKDLKIVFSEAMDPVTISPRTIELRDASKDLVATTVIYDEKTNTVTLSLRSPVGDYTTYTGKVEKGVGRATTPKGKTVPGVTRMKLAKKTTYTATVVGGAKGVKDLAGNSMKKDFSWSFTTVKDEDTDRPTVVSVTPPDRSVNVSTGGKISVTFSEPMDSQTIKTGTFLLRDLSNKRIPASILYDENTNTATLALKVPLVGEYNLEKSTSYTVTMVGGDAGVKDLAGNPMQIDFSWSFTTAGSQQ